MALDTLTGNRLLDGLPKAVLAELRPRLEAVDLPLRSRLECHGQNLTHAYFPTAGIASVVASGHALPGSEAGMAGREGMTGTSLILGDDRSMHDVVVQVGGQGWRMEADAFRAAMEISDVRRRMLRYLQAHMAQMYGTILACNHAKLETRLARWLLMCHDRVQGDAFELTHEYMALMLGVRRAGVTVALHELEGRGYIRSTRGLVEIRDREAMEMSTDGFYGAPERAYDRLLGAKGCTEQPLRAEL